ncbi:MAG: class I SAM-dependent methyltransferase [Trueperaceae bacterium]
MEKIKAFLKLEFPLASALDVACGTGQSTRALSAIAREVTGTDLSEEMLTFAKQEETTNIHYVQSPAEQLPFPDATFDLITVSLAFHWFDRKRFFLEAARGLKDKGWLVIYSNNFASMMKANPDFEPFAKNVYLQRYSPPRNSETFTLEDVKRFGFAFASHETYSNEISFTPETLANYLMTQSNVIAKLEGGSEHAEDIYTWLIKALTPLMPEGHGFFTFKGDVLYLQKQA